MLTIEKDKQKHETGPKISTSMQDNLWHRPAPSDTTASKSADFFLPDFLENSTTRLFQPPTEEQFREVHESLKTRPLFLAIYQFGHDANTFIEAFEAAISVNGLIRQDPQKAIAVCQFIDLGVLVAIRRLIPQVDYFKSSAIYDALKTLNPAPINDHSPSLYTFRKQRVGEPYAEYGEHIRNLAQRCSKPGTLAELAMVRVFVRGLVNEEAKRLLQYASHPPRSLNQCYDQLHRSVAVFPHYGVLAPVIAKSSLPNHNQPDKDSSEKECKYCKKKGHAVDECRKLMRRKMAEMKIDDQDL